MQSSARSHTSYFGLRWNTPGVSISLLLALFLLILLLLFMTITAPPAYGQQSVPRTAREAATMPQYAAKLGRPAQPVSPHIASRAPQPQSDVPRASYKNPPDHRARTRGSGPLDGTLYDNGPINGTTDAWTINGGFVVSDTFTVPSGGSGVQGLTFAAWAFPGDVLQSVEVSISSQALGGGTIYSDQVINFTQSGCSGNQYGFNVCTETSGNVAGPNLAAGTYWVNLQNAVVNTGDPIYWDENSGIGCNSGGCPSEAAENSVGTIPSEAFTILGNATTSCPPPEYCSPECAHDEGNFQLIHTFNRNEQPADPGLAIDQGNVYGSMSSGGEYGFGSAYQLALHAGSWIFTPLYSFLGGANGQNPRSWSEIVGPYGALYGIADGGVQNCGSSGNQYCGVIYRLTPSPNPCLTALCSWIEDVIYTFTGNDDSPNGRLVFDGAETLFGATGLGGLYGNGTIYKLAPSGGGWTKTTIYSFTGGYDGAYPNLLSLFQRDGYLYGESSAGAFRLGQTGGNRVLTILSSALCAEVQDSEGNIYCRGYSSPPDNTHGEIYKLSYGNWIGSLVEDTSSNFYCSDPNLPPCYDVFNGLGTDSSGGVYATEGANYHYYDPRCGQYNFVCFGNVHRVGTHQWLADFGQDVFRDLEAGDTGKLYGTVGACGSYSGAVWQLSP